VPPRRPAGFRTAPEVAALQLAGSKSVLPVSNAHWKLWRHNLRGSDCAIDGELKRTKRNKRNDCAIDGAIHALEWTRHDNLEGGHSPAYSGSTSLSVPWLS
jgi:hypothetical protein